MNRVEWSARALAELAEYWTNGDSNRRAALTQAAGQIDALLTADAIHEGESRGNGRRIVFVAPLAVTFFVNERLKIVTVLWLRLLNSLDS